MLEDKDTIRELMHRYCCCMDEGRFAERPALFTDDGDKATARSNYASSGGS